MAIRRTRKDTAVLEDRGGAVATAPPPNGSNGGRALDPLSAKELVRPGGRRIGELLVGKDLITTSQLAETLMQQEATTGKRLGQLLVELGALDERDLALTLAEQLNLALVDLRQDTPEQAAVALLPETMARSLNAIPMLQADETVIVAVADPSPQLAQQLANTVGSAVTLVVAVPSDIRRAIDSSYRALAGVDQAIEAFQRTEGLRVAAARVQETSTQDDAPVVQVVNLMITQALRDRASDIHVEPQEGRVRVRYRIDGALHDVLAIPGEMGPALVSRIKIMANLNIVERRRSQDGQIAMEIEGRALDIRVATTATIWGEKVVMRLLDKSRPLYKLGELGMPPETHATYSEIIRAPFGMVICTGPTGAGKTTTLYGSLSEINSPDRNITTIEDPVEYVFPSINQIQINEQAGLTFAGGLKSILRQDPDVILVGEIRDVDTARIAVQAALTGHFVLSSLHATDTAAALHRFLDMGIESFLIASSIRAVVSQRLLRRVCGDCKTTYKPTVDEMALYEEIAGTVTKRKFYRGAGCNFCAGSGYQERIGVYELMKITPEIKRLIVGWATQDEIRKLAVSQGMRTLREEAIALVDQDLTTISEVFRNIYTV